MIAPFLFLLLVWFRCELLSCQHLQASVCSVLFNKSQSKHCTHSLSRFQLHFLHRLFAFFVPIVDHTELIPNLFFCLASLTFKVFMFECQTYMCFVLKYEKTIKIALCPIRFASHPAISTQITGGRPNLKRKSLVSKNLEFFFSYFSLNTNQLIVFELSLKFIV